MKQNLYPSLLAQSFVTHGDLAETLALWCDDLLSDSGLLERLRTLHQQSKAELDSHHVHDSYDQWDAGRGDDIVSEERDWSGRSA